MVLLLSTVILSCESDSIETPTTSIIGKWNGDAIEFSGTAEGQFNGLPVTADVIGQGYDLNFSYTLTEDPNLATSEGVYSMEITISLLGQEQKEIKENIEFDFSGSWSQTENTLVLIIEGEEVVAKISELTETTLVLEFNVEQVEEIDGNEVILNMNMVISFVR